MNFKNFFVWHNKKLSLKKSIENRPSSKKIFIWSESRLSYREMMMAEFVVVNGVVLKCRLKNNTNIKVDPPIIEETRDSIQIVFNKSKWIEKIIRYLFRKSPKKFTINDFPRRIISLKLGEPTIEETKNDIRIVFEKN